MKKSLLKIFGIVLILFLIKDIILISVLKFSERKVVNAYFNNDSSFNYKSNLILRIPKINLTSIVKKSDDDFKNLDSYLVYYKHDNYKEKIIIFGHSGMGYGVHFNRLDELLVGDIAYIYKNRFEITYEVSKKYTVLDTQVNLLNNDKRGILLLITCEKKDKNKRLVVELTLKGSKTLTK